MADTQTEALIKAALYYEHPQYDLVVEQAEITFVQCADTSKMHYTFHTIEHTGSSGANRANDWVV